MVNELVNQQSKLNETKVETNTQPRYPKEIIKPANVLTKQFLNKNHLPKIKNKFVVPALLIAVALVIVFFFIFKNKGTANTPPSTTPTPNQNDGLTPPDSTTSKPGEWKTYTNLQFGFQFQFPPDLSSLPKDQTPPGFIPVCPNENIICLTYSENPYPKSSLEAVGFSIQTISGIEDEISCATYSADNQNVTKLDKSKLINGAKFYYGKNGVAATGHQLESGIFRTFHDGICFELQQNIATSFCEVDFPESCPNKFTDSNKERLFSTLDQVVSTFKFSGSQQSVTRTPSTREKGGCIISGCSSEICSDKVKFSTCELKTGTECYKTAICERQDKGYCGWTQTEELTDCLSNSQ